MQRHILQAFITLLGADDDFFQYGLCGSLLADQAGDGAEAGQQRFIKF